MEWKFVWDPPRAAELGARLPQVVLLIAPDQPVSFEELCAKLESKICQRRHGLVCACCAQDNVASQCRSCQHAIGFHTCTNPELGTATLRWRKGTLHGGQLDIERVVYNLHRKGLPMHALEEKADEYSICRHLGQRCDRNSTIYQMLTDALASNPANTMANVIS